MPTLLTKRILVDAIVVVFMVVAKMFATVRAFETYTFPWT